MTLTPFEEGAGLRLEGCFGPELIGSRFVRRRRRMETKAKEFRGTDQGVYPFLWADGVLTLRKNMNHQVEV